MDTDKEGIQRHDEPFPHHPVKIFNILPEATADTFKQSLIFQSTSKERKALVFYAPDLQNIGCIDNTGSEGSAEYAKSVTTGFELSSTVTLSQEAGAEANFEIMKASLKVTFSISFTAQYSKSTTETMTFSVPAGKKAFNYQGYMYTTVIVHNVGTAEYSYDNSTRGTFFTNVLATSPNPLVGKAVISDQ